MDKITTLPTNDQVRKEAESWIIRLDQQEVMSSADKFELEAWLARSPAHYRELEAANRFWSNNILTHLAVPLSYEQVASKQPLAASSAVAVNRLSFKVILGYGSALSLAMMLLVAVYFHFTPPINSTNGLYVTAVGQRNTLTLADGSVLELNTNSQVGVEFSGDYRNIRLLQGEVHFSVAHDTNKPFRVYAVGNRVQAIGTAFSVQIKNQSLNVLVTEGRVGLAALSRKPSRDINTAIDSFTHSYETDIGLLKAKESIVLTEAGLSRKQVNNTQHEILAISDDELYRRTSWRDGLLIFQGETLEEAVTEISRYTTVTIEISDPDVRRIQVGGRFQVGDIDTLLSALETNFNLKADYVAYNRVQLTLIR